MTKRPSNGLRSVVLVVLLSLTVPALLTDSAAQSPTPEDPGWTEADGTGDVELTRFDGSPAATVPDSEKTQKVDITSLSVVRETGVEIEFSIGLVALPGPREQAEFVVCFQVDQMRYALDSFLHGSGRLISRGDQPCITPTSKASPDGEAGLKYTGLTPRIDAASKSIFFRLPRTLLAELASGQALGPGSKLSSLSADSFQEVSFVQPLAWLHDSVPQEGPSSRDLVLAGYTRNIDVKVAIAQNSTAPSCLHRGGEPVLIMEAGTFTPLRAKLFSRLPSATKFTITGIADAPGWTVRAIPELTMPSGPSETNPTLAIQPANAAQKVCTLVHVIATSAADASKSGELVVEVIAQAGLSKDLPTLHFHLDGPRGGGARGLYLNVFDEDPTSNTPADSAYKFQRIGPFINGQGSVEPTSSGRWQTKAKSEFPFPYGVVLPSQATLQAHIGLASEGVPSHARIGVGVSSGKADELLAYGEVEVVIPVQSTPVDVVIPVLMRPDEWRSPTRMLEADKPITVTLQYEGAPANPPAPAAVGNGIVTWFIESTSIAFDVLDTIRSTRVGVGIDDSIAYLSVADGNQTKRVNPGRTAEFQFSLAYESDASDVFVVRANTSAPGWRILRPVQGSSIGPVDRSVVPVSILVLAPENATEGTEARIGLSVEGKVSKARADASVVATIAKDKVHGAVYEAPSVAKKTPAGGPILTICTAMGLAFILGRREGR